MELRYDPRNIASDYTEAIKLRYSAKFIKAYTSHVTEVMLTLKVTDFIHGQFSRI